MTDHHQTRLKVLDDSVKAISESQTNLRREMSESQANLRREIDSVASSVADQSKLLQEVLARLKLLPSKHPPDSDFRERAGISY
ncbi:hypothetical protein AAHA92_10490 [Salvia divinorum]|uniref:Uncharacterized protein n=1 Tax=Salvia divinorum TaxID=28513 RepID=A0ABD1HXE4_SALDI